jgi:hypothetical protein
MTSGSMLIHNSLGGKSLLTFKDEIYNCTNPNDLIDARAELKRMKANPSPPAGHIIFLEQWIDGYEKMCKELLAENLEFEGKTDKELKDELEKGA